MLAYYQKGKWKLQAYLAPTGVLLPFSMQGWPGFVASEVPFPKVKFHSVHLLYLDQEQRPTIQNIPKSPSSAPVYQEDKTRNMFCFWHYYCQH